MERRRVSRRYSRRAALRLGAGATGAALFTAACGGGGAVPSGTPDDAGLPRKLELQPRARAQTPAPTGVARLGVLDSTTLDPAHLSDDTRFYAYSRLVAVDPRSATIYGDLATKVEAPDAVTVNFTLTNDAHFHPGADGHAQPLRASDIQFDFERRAAAGEFLFTQVIDKVETHSNVLTLHLKGPFCLLFELLGSHAAGVRSEQSYAAFQEPLGSGPFIPTQSSVSDGTVTLSRHPGYHQKGYPRLSSLTVAHFRSDADWAARFASGLLDVWAQSATQSPVGTPAPGVQRMTRPATRMRGLGLSLLPQRGGTQVRHVEAFQDQRVRQAIALALDRPALLAVDPSMTSGPVGPAHASDALPQAELAANAVYQRDVARAHSLLQAAGQEKLSFRIQLPDLDPLRGYGQLVAEQLAEAGFDPHPLVQDTKGWEATFNAGDFEAAVFEMSGLTTPDLGLRLHTASGVDGRYSLWGYSNPVYDAAVRTALSQLNPADRARESRKAQRLLLDDVPAMFPIAAPVEEARVTSRVTGYEYGAYDFNMAWLASSWTTTASLPTATPT